MFICLIHERLARLEDVPRQVGQLLAVVILEESLPSGLAILLPLPWALLRGRFLVFFEETWLIFSQF